METHKNHAYGAKSVTRETEKKRCFLGYGFKVLNFFGQKQPQNFFFLIIWAQKSKKSIRIFVVIIFVVFVFCFFCLFVVVFLFFCCYCCCCFFFASTWRLIPSKVRDYSAKDFAKERSQLEGEVFNEDILYTGSYHKIC